MLEIRKEVLWHLEKVFALSEQEQGFVLGTNSQLTRLDCCYQIPAASVGMYYYSPDVDIANKIIKLWAAEGICFCGFIHSHVIEKREFSENDVEFAKKLVGAYKLPVLWFGLAIVNDDKVDIDFYAVTKIDDLNIDILPVEVNAV